MVTLKISLSLALEPEVGFLKPLVLNNCKIEMVLLVLRRPHFLGKAYTNVEDKVASL